MFPETPDWTPFDPDAPRTAPPPPAPGSIVVLLSRGEGGGGDPWAPRAACALARVWRADGRKVVLVDGGVGDPSLHHVLGLPNTEGLADAALSGASPRRIARPTADGGPLFIPAGSPAGDPAAIFEGPRWRDLALAFVQVDALLLLYLPPREQEAARRVVAAADAIVVLGRPGDAAEGPADTAGRVLARLCPSPIVAHPSEDEELPDPLDPHAVDPLQAASGDDGAAGAIHAAEAGARSPAEGTHRPHADPQRPLAAPVSWTVRRAAPAAVAVLALLALWVGWTLWPRTGPLAPGGEPATPATDARPTEARTGEGAVETPALVEPGASGPSPTATPADVTSPVQAYSLALASFRNAAVAEERRRTLVRQFSSRTNTADGASTGVLLYLAPVDVNGTPYYRLLAGPVEDSATARSLATRLAEALQADPTSWVIRPTPRSFLLTEAPDIGEAGAAAAEWEAQGIPTHVLAVERTDGTRTFRVYAGGYATEGEAAYLEGLIAAAGGAGSGGALTLHRGVVPRVEGAGGT